MPVPAPVELQKILDDTRKAINDYAGGDHDKWHYANRFIFARLQGDSRAITNRVKKELFESNPVCNSCRKKLESLRGIHCHRIDGDRGYSVENCVLMHPECHQARHNE